MRKKTWSPDLLWTDRFLASVEHNYRTVVSFWNQIRSQRHNGFAYGSCYSQSTTLQIDVCGAFVWVVEHNVLLSRCSVPFCRTEKACVLENYFILESLFCIVDETSIINGFFCVWRVVWCGVVARTVKLYLREVNQLTWMNWIAKAVKTKDTWKSSDLCGRKYRSLWIGLFCDGVCGVVWLPWQSNFIWGT